MVNITSLTQEFTFSEAGTALIPFLLYMVSIFIYSIFVFHFYKYLARKNIFEVREGGFSKFILYIFKYIFLFPVIALFWVIFLSVLLMLLSKNNTLSGILLLSTTVVAAIRLTAYYNESLSQDLAKMLPFALLGVFLVDASFFSFNDVLNLLGEFPLIWETLLYYYFFIIIIEIVAKFISLPFGGKSVS